MEYDFIVGFTLFTPKGFRTMYRHFDNLDIAKMFASNVNIKDNSKIYVDLKYLQDKIKSKIEYYEKIDNPVGKRVLQSFLENKFPTTITKEELEKRWKE